MEVVYKFFDSIWFLVLSWIIFCGDGFDDGAGKTCLHTGITCFDGVTWFFFKEAISFFNRFIPSSCLGFCVFSSSVFDVAEAVDLGLLWSRLFCLFIRSFWLKLLIGKFFLCCRCFPFISSFFLKVALISTRSLFSSFLTPSVFP